VQARLSAYFIGNDDAAQAALQRKQRLAGPFSILWPLLKLTVGPFYWNQRSTTLVVEARLRAAFEDYSLLRTNGGSDDDAWPS
jgi:hypothetical protein